MLILKALFGDDWLFDHLVLKGGNALSLVYNVGGRSSLDLDFSIEGDFEDSTQVSNRMAGSLSATFEEAGIRVFDFRLEPKPKFGETGTWGGYVAEFKLIPVGLASRLDFRTDNMRRQALTIDPGSQRRRHRVEISKFEYVGVKGGSEG